MPIRRGYPDEWIKRRVQSIETRKALTEEWKNRGVKEGHEYSILTAVIAKGSFVITPFEHSKLKGKGGFSYQFLRLERK